MKSQFSRTNRAGFTLLELLVVVAILAVIAGGLIVSYEGLDTKAASSVSTYNINGVDQAVRQYVAVNRTSPDGWDSLMFSSDGTFTNSALLPLLSNELKDTTNGLLTAYALSEDEANALSAGMQRLDGAAPSLWYVSGTATNSVLGSYPTAPATPANPNRVFDAPPTGWGVSTSFAEGIMMARVNPLTIRGATLLGNVLKFSSDDVVIAMGLGFNSSLIKPEHGGVGLSEAPFDGGVTRTQYGRFLVLFHLGKADDIEEKAHLVGVLDARGNYFDAAYSQAVGQAGE